MPVKLICVSSNGSESEAYIDSLPADAKGLFIHAYKKFYNACLDCAITLEYQETCIDIFPDTSEPFWNFYE